MFQRVRLGSGEVLALDATPPRDAGLTAVYCHGLGSRRGGEKARFLESELARRGLGFARFDFRGHGESDGRFDELTLTRQLEDLAAVLRHLRSEAAGPAPRAFVLIGASLGALTAAWHCARAAPEPVPVVAQVLIAPAFRILDRYLAALGEFGRARWRREGTYRFVGPWFEFDLKWSAIEDAERYSHAELLAAPRPPTLIVHGTADDSAPIAVSEEFVAGCSAPRPRLIAIEGGDHRLTHHKERLLDEILRFIEVEAGAASTKAAGEAARTASRRERCSGSSS